MSFFQVSVSADLSGAVGILAKSILYPSETVNEDLLALRSDAYLLTEDRKLD